MKRNINENTANASDDLFTSISNRWEYTVEMILTAIKLPFHLHMKNDAISYNRRRCKISIQRNSGKQQIVRYQFRRSPFIRRLCSMPHNDRTANKNDGQMCCTLSSPGRTKQRAIQQYCPSFIVLQKVQEYLPSMSRCSALAGWLYYILNSIRKHYHIISSLFKIYMYIFI